MTKLIIDKIKFDNKNPLFIAEIGNNHQGCLKQCKELFLAAKQSGANAVKLQKRNNKTLFTKKAYNEPYNSENSFACSYGKHRDYLELGKREYLELKKYAKKIDIIFFATAFDFESADFLNNEIDLPAFKIASGDILNLPLIEYVSKFNKPIILSTGCSTMKDVIDAFNVLKKKSNNFAILQCTASYPCEPEELNLNVINSFKKRFKNILVGLSSHHNGISQEIVAYMLGARIFEKHFTLNRSLKGTDHSFSLTPLGLSKLIRDIKRIPISLGSSNKKPINSEKKPVLKMRKSIVAAKNLKKYDIIKHNDVLFKCPGNGLPPKDIDKILGKKLKRNIEIDQIIIHNDLK